MAVNIITALVDSDDDGILTEGVGAGSVSNGDYGDITVSVGGTVWTIDNSVVGTAKLGVDITTAGKAILDDADAAAQRTTLGAAAASHTHAPSEAGGSPFGGTVASPTALSANVNDWDPFGGNAAVTLVRGATDGTLRNVTGITGGTAGRVFVLFNTSAASGSIVLNRENASSSAANRIVGPTGAGDVNIGPGAAILLFYDGTTSRWRPI